MIRILWVSVVTSFALMALAAGAKKPAWKHGYAEINGLKLHYAAAGKGKTVLFLHGFPEFWYAWKDQLVEFGKDHHAIAMDMRGYNLSAKPDKLDEYAMPKLVADVQGLLDKFSKGKKAILVGHDWGGVVAWVFAAAHPEYLEKLVIINAPHPAIFARELASNPAQQKASGYMNIFRGEGAEGLLSANQYAALANAIFNGAVRPDAFTEEDRRAYLEAWAQPGALTGGLNYYRAGRVGPPAPSGEPAGAPPDIAALGPSLAVKVPTLVLWGEKDRALLTGNLNGLEQFVPDLQVKRIAEGSHWVVHEEPARINGYIRDFIRPSREGRR